ncbi:MAG: DNA polymerase/3'-5' exonuclease PolX, partial [Bacteroidota bacterium]|nr:DNA polymerase/3'-5' exonuclease PolX [Bacteroidota bacterium]
LEVESLGELLYACNENRLTLYKGFGEKTQNNIRESIEFYFGSLGRYLYQQLESVAHTLEEKLQQVFPDQRFTITGEFRRQMEIIDTLEWVTTTSTDQLEQFFSEQGFTVLKHTTDYFSCKGKENIRLGFYTATKENFISCLFRTTASEPFLLAWNEQTGWDATRYYETEEALFEAAGIHPIPAFQRETAAIIHQAKQQKLPQVIQPADIKGIIHSHSNWSDGVHTLEQMAENARISGWEYLVISDHSKSAFYANGLQEDRILAQHRQIDELNSHLAPFTIFKSIESDILNDGSLDYAADILNRFDLVIASIHSNLKMNEEKAMMRLIRAIENPFTSILGHMTGRLLLSRNGYPVDHQRIIDACAANQVVIELNAHPRRLDMDWRWIDKAMEKDVLISIDPDAHAIEGFADCRYGVLVAQKAGLPKEKNLSSFSLAQMELFIRQQKAKRPAV